MCGLISIIYLIFHKNTSTFNSTMNSIHFQKKILWFSLKYVHILKNQKFIGVVYLGGIFGRVFFIANPGNKGLARQLYLYACLGSCQVSRRRRAWCRPWRTGECRSCSQRSARPASGTPSHPHPARYPHSGPPPAPQQCRDMSKRKNIKFFETTTYADFYIVEA